MKCERCDVVLQRGSVHVSLDGCIEALKEALEKATKCAACGDVVPTVIHPGCIPAEVARRGANAGTAAIERRVIDWLAGKSSKKKPSRSRDEQDEEAKNWDP